MHVFLRMMINPLDMDSMDILSDKSIFQTSHLHVWTGFADLWKKEEPDEPSVLMRDVLEDELVLEVVVELELVEDVVPCKSDSTSKSP